MVCTEGRYGVPGWVILISDKAKGWMNLFLQIIAFYDRNVLVVKRQTLLFRFLADEAQGFKANGGVKH